MEGKLIVIEGMDGSGKNTQSTKLYNKLKEEGYKVIQVSFPNYDNESSILVKKYLNGDYKNQYGRDNLTFVKQICSFYMVDRISSFIEEKYEGKSLIQLLKEGTHIICDRYTTSNMLHQPANLTNKRNIYALLDWIEEREYFDLGLPIPDIVLFLDVMPQVSLMNIKKRYEGLENKEDLHENIEHLKRVFQSKDKVVKYFGWEVIKCCNEKGEMFKENTIHKEIIKKLKNRFREFEKIQL
jgi:dTMP kinase